MLTLAPLYFEGEIAFGVITQGSSAFRTILAALSFVVSRFDSLGGLMAETARITALESQLTAEGTAAARHERDALRQDDEREKGQRCIRRRALVGRECDVADGREAWSLNIIARLAIVVRRLRKR